MVFSLDGVSSCGVATIAAQRQDSYLAGGSAIKRNVLEFAGFLMVLHVGGSPRVGARCYHRHGLARRRPNGMATAMPASSARNVNSMWVKVQCKAKTAHAADHGASFSSQNPRSIKIPRLPRPSRRDLTERTQINADLLEFIKR
jgi:hypothetical protein